MAWRIWTWWARWREDHFGDPQEGWNVTAIKADIERAGKQDEDPQTGRHQRRSP